MALFADKIQNAKDKNALIKRAPHKENSSKLVSPFIDNRPSAIAQRKLQEMIYKKSADTFQMKYKSPETFLQKKENHTGLPDNLKSGVENLSGYSMDDVKVHYHSNKPSPLQAHAYAQGTNIHVASGQEKHLPHEAWHVVQQKQGRVKPIKQMKGVAINNDSSLEKEANIMGNRATTFKENNLRVQQQPVNNTMATVQRVIGDQKVGAKVIHNKTKELYTIIDIPTKDKYTLESVSKIQKPITVGANDENFDVFTEAPKQKEQQSSGIGNIFSSFFSTSELTPSEAYAKARKDEVQKTWPKISKEVEIAKQTALKLESENPNSQAFYNAAGLGAHTLHRIIQVIYEVYEDVRVRDFVFFRAVGNQPRKETTKGPQKFLETRDTQNGWSDHSETTSMMSTNITLMANVADSSESTFDIMQSGGLFDVNPKKTVEIIKNMLLHLGINESLIKHILKEVEELALTMDKVKSKNRESKSLESVLYQTFIPNKLVGQLVYIASKNGLPLDDKYSFVEPLKVLEGIALAGKELKDQSMVEFGSKFLQLFDKMKPKEKQELLRGEKFTKMTLAATKSTAFWKMFGGKADPQARILMHPKVFSSPTGLAKTVTHSNMSPKTTHILEEGLSNIAKITQQVKTHEVFLAVKQSIELYGFLYEKYKGSIDKIKQMPYEELVLFRKKIYQEVRNIDSYIQDKVWDVIGDSEQLKDLIKNKKLKVKCRGKLILFDIDIPMQMLPEELEELIKLLQEKKTVQKEVNLLDFTF